MKAYISAIIALITTTATLSAFSGIPSAPSLIQGRVFDKKTGANVATRVTLVNAATGDTLAQSKSNSSSGKYTAVISEEKSFTLKIIVECEGYAKSVQTVKFVYTREYQEITQDVPLEPHNATVTPSSQANTPPKKLPGRKKKKK